MRSFTDEWAMVRRGTETVVMRKLQPCFRKRGLVSGSYGYSIQFAASLCWPALTLYSQVCCSMFATGEQPDVEDHRGLGLQPQHIWPGATHTQGDYTAARASERRWWISAGPSYDEQDQNTCPEHLPASCPWRGAEL
ncbi:hypothetical protein D4764_02G0009600 [Takifugu flavidus]|uniref:Uncharacterized protein n=1 Tax=Takifugu flavidus TaxID=433684 RepID=A0A5C6NMQ0_9TELE|nr:hypothetical protein D4764_02G0009600 [Takifugu flavidus]